MLFDNRLLHLTSQTMIIDLIQMRELESIEADKVNLSDFDEIIDVILNRRLLSPRRLVTKSPPTKDESKNSS